MAIFMNVPGVSGDILEYSHSKWIRVAYVSWGARRALSTALGSATDRDSTAPAMNEIEIKRASDIATVGLLQRFWTGENQDVTLHFVRTGDPNAPMYVYYKILLSSAILTSFNQESDGDDPFEIIKMDFVKITVRTIQMAADGSPGNPLETGYDLSVARPF
jgi:type VI protein secretion system component Hcp